MGVTESGLPLELCFQKAWDSDSNAESVLIEAENTSSRQLAGAVSGVFKMANGKVFACVGAMSIRANI